MDEVTHKMNRLFQLGGFTMSRIVRWNPFNEIVDMQRQLDRAFNDMNRRMTDNEWTTSSNALALDVTETDEHYQVEANLPGINAEDIDITLHENVLTITAEINRTEQQEGSRALLNERYYGRFERSIRLPKSVDGDKVEANYQDGVLMLTLEKSEASRPRQIAVNNNRVLTTEN